MMIEDEKGYKASCKGISQNSIRLETIDEKVSTEDQHGQCTQTGRQPIYTIDKIERVDHHDDGEIRKCECKAFRQLLKSKQAMHAVDPDLSEVNEDRCSYHLANKFFAGR